MMTFVLLFLCLEGWARHVGLQALLNPNTLEEGTREKRCSQLSMTRGYTPIPSLCSRNSHALVGEEVRPRQETESRILVLGDSLTDRYGWLHMLQKKHEDVDFLNAAVTGYNTCQERNFFSELDPILQPDAIIIQMCPNDLSGSPVLTPIGDGTFRYFTGDKAFDFPSWVLHSRLLTYGVLQYGAANMARQWRISDSDSLAFSRGCLQLLQKEAGDRPLVAVVFPSLMPTGNTERNAWKLEEKIYQLLDELNISYLKLRPVLEEGGDIRRLQERPNDIIHPSLEGHKLASQAVEQFLRDHQLLK